MSSFHISQAILRKWLYVGVWLATGVLVVMGLLCLYAAYVEPTWLRERTVRLSPQPRVRLVQITDTHYRGNGTVVLIGITGVHQGMPFPPVAGAVRTRVLLLHDPQAVSGLTGTTFDLILSGHTHGGQLRSLQDRPLLDLLFVKPFDRGLFHTPAGPLYVNSGIGTYFMNVRFGCRPEVTLLEL